MATPTSTTAPDVGSGAPVPRPAPARAPRRRSAGADRPNYLGGLSGLLWLAIIIVPVYWVVITSFKPQSAYYTSNPMLPAEPTLENYQAVIEADFLSYFVNSVIVTVGATVPAVLLSFMAAFAIVRGGRGRFLRVSNTVFLMGLACPTQAVIIPVYLIIIRLSLYDSHLALILPSIAFAIPLSVLILANFIRDVPNELFESMRMDGASEWGTMWRLAFPLTQPALITVSIYQGLQVWNAFLLPLVLTQSPEMRVLPLALWAFQGEYGINVPAVLASVVLATLPILALYVVGRRHLLAGMTAGFSK
ncbi:carbohydrate ABC transporter permease [Pseudonocardia kunmingensis]|uniref:Carbohydrate ABC transporter membrane protein 2 (CUT1 family) n=1 Tax=Pseudonocardia kunmingensis TaxID=630975 RepID=A0A543DRQ0_9PSEU|nr:carbohydrate ABC transporter permease [Pseudonocardia kunmingensis]TQM12010.1 carbohydrate ABC transporter membrane protein 2 (CUT1 family) [Pseudonocardia kunmingensis]